MIWNTGKPDRYLELYYKRSKLLNRNKENCPPTTQMKIKLEWHTQED